MPIAVESMKTRDIIDIMSPAPAPRQTHGLNPRRAAFTLIELLVVLGIVLVLAGLLIPVIKQVRQAVKTTECGANLAQTGMYLFEYINLNENRFPGSGQSTGSVSWHDILNTELLRPKYSTAVYRNQGWNQSPLRCPNLDRSILWRRCWAMNVNATPGNYDPVKNTYQYGIPADPTGRGYNFTFTRYALGAFIGRFTDKPRTLMVGDVFTGADSIYDASSFYGGSRHGPGNLSVNVLFMDGHVETVANSRLWSDIKYAP